jgi:hypothetical protein
VEDIMRKLLVIGLVVAAILVSCAAMAEIDLFKGIASGYRPGTWGSGFCTLVNDRPFAGNCVIKITTQGLHEGGRLDFTTPVQMVSEDVDSEYLQFTIRFTTISLTSDNAFFGPGFNVTSMPGLMNPKMAAYYYQETDVPIRAKISTLRLVMMSSDEKSVEICTGVPMKSEEGWFKISIPMKKFGFKAGDSFQLSRMMFFSDIPDTFAIGQISVIKDDVPITANPGEDQEVPVNEPVLLTADADGGSTELSYSWNFGDSGGAGEDATGPVVTHRFKSGGDYTVKLTVSDAWGIKAPVTVSTLVSVNDPNR